MVWHLNPYVAEGGVQVRLLVLQRIRPQVLLREWILVRLLVQVQTEAPCRCVRSCMRKSVPVPKGLPYLQCLPSLPSLLRPRNFRHPPAWWIWVVPG